MVIKTFDELLNILYSNDKVEVYKELFGNFDDDATERMFNATLLHMYKNDQIAEEALLEYLNVTQGDVVEALSECNDDLG